MDASPVLQIGPYAFVSVPLFIAGLVSTYYVVRFQVQTPAGDRSQATWFMAAALGGLTLSVVALFLNTALVGWGALFFLLPDALVVFCLAAVLGFVYHHPRPECRSRETRLAMVLAGSVMALAFGYSIYYTVTDRPVHPAYPYLMPSMLLITLALALRRTIAVHRTSSVHPHPGRGRAGKGVAGEVISALLRPHPPAQALRNVALALSLGLVQGAASALSVVHLLPLPYDLFIIGLSLLVMVVILVYSCWHHVARQPRLSVRLVGLSLVTLLAILGAVGLLDVHAAVEQSVSERSLETAVVRSAVLAGDLTALPDAVVYVLDTSPAPGGGLGAEGAPVRAIYARDQERDLALLPEVQARLAGTPFLPPRWGYYFDVYLMTSRPSITTSFYYGSRSQNLIRCYQYVAFHFAVDGHDYQALFSLDEANRPVHRHGLTMSAVVILASLFILIIFPLFFRASILAPLDRLLSGVERANAGDLNVAVPITSDDEIGFLTRSFNDLVASIKAEMAGRKETAAALRELAGTLEQRVASRTHELGLLYEISAAASQAQNLEMLLARALAQTQAALQGEMGLMFLFDPREGLPGPARLRLIARPGVPPDTLPAQATLPAYGGLFTGLLQENTPLLILDLSADPRVPPAMRALGARALLLAPLCADGQVLGALGLIRPPGQSFSTEDVALLATIADQVGLAVHSDRLRRQAAVLEERQRLARDLHDSVTQLLYGLVRLAEAGQAQLKGAAAASAGATFVRVVETSRQALNEMRLFVHHLHPPELEERGLVAALAQRLAAVESWSGVRARLFADETLQLSPRVECALYQIAQEALNNALRHAHATTITVRLVRQPAGVLLEIDDDGCGFDPQETLANRCGLGLHTMRYRAEAIDASLETISSPDGGTQVRISLGGIGTEPGGFHVGPG